VTRSFSCPKLSHSPAQIDNQTEAPSKEPSETIEFVSSRCFPNTAGGTAPMRREEQLLGARSIHFVSSTAHFQAWVVFPGWSSFFRLGTLHKNKNYPLPRPAPTPGDGDSCRWATARAQGWAEENTRRHHQIIFPHDSSRVRAAATPLACPYGR